MAIAPATGPADTLWPHTDMQGWDRRSTTTLHEMRAVMLLAPSG